MGTPSPVTAVNLTDEELLEYYLSLPSNQRDEIFIDSASAAKITGLSRRTIQLWIESGAVRAIVVGRKYRIVSDSLRSYLKNRMFERG